MTKIPLIKTYSTEPNDNSPPWFAPKTLGILSTDVQAHAKMHGALAMAHEQSKAQYHLQQASHHLIELDHLTVILYLTHHRIVPKPPVAELIPWTPTSRYLINKACASWQRGIEQMMITAKLIIVRSPHSTISPPPPSNQTENKTWTQNATGDRSCHIS